jgi:hypothetical protein
MIAMYPTSFDTPPEKAVSRNFLVPVVGLQDQPPDAIPPHKKRDTDTRQNGVSAPNFEQKRAVIRCRRGINSTNMNDVCWGNATEITREIGSSVTTSHVFWPNQRRRAASPLPIWLRNSVSRSPEGESPERGAGGSAARSGQNHLIHELTWNFIANGSPALFCDKKNNAGTRRQRPMPTSAPTVTTVP